MIQKSLNELRIPDTFYQKHSFGQHFFILYAMWPTSKTRQFHLWRDSSFSHMSMTIAFQIPVKHCHQINSWRGIDVLTAFLASYRRYTETSWSILVDLSSIGHLRHITEVFLPDTATMSSWFAVLCGFLILRTGKSSKVLFWSVKWAFKCCFTGCCLGLRGTYLSFKDVPSSMAGLTFK